MKKSKKRLLGFIVLSVCFVLPARSQQDNLAKLTLEECIVHAVKHNLGLAVQVYSSELADLAVSRAQEKYLPGLSFDFGKQNQNSASYSWLNASDVQSSSNMNYGSSINQVIPFGGKFMVSLSGYKSSSNSRFQTINPYYGSTLTLSLSQPFLKNFGWQISRNEILVARNNRDIADSDLKNALLATVYSVEQAYWEYVYAVESLNVRRQSLKLAEDLLEKSRKEVNIGTLAPKEILSAQAEVASRKADILQGELQVKDDADGLRTLINLPATKTVEEIVPADRPSFEKRDITFDAALATALINRPDLRASELNVKNRELDLSYAKNQTLPALNLEASYWSPGISGDRILFLDNNPLTGIVLGTIPGGASVAMRDALGFRYNNWSVSLSLDVPLNNVFSRAVQAQAQAALARELARLKNTEQAAFLEIRSAVRAVQTNYERVDAYKAARELAEQKLAAEEAKLKAGMSDNFRVLQYQRDLAQARTYELRAIIDYTLSLARLDKALGTSLDKKNIKLTDAWEVRS
ncbi:MAG: TolC family protein [Candidatus Aminicenantes bacterium]|nr:TolC family protein [Candidatus Aminicenantes bacterium]